MHIHIHATYTCTCTCTVHTCITYTFTLTWLYTCFPRFFRLRKEIPHILPLKSRYLQDNICMCVCVYACMYAHTDAYTLHAKGTVAVTNSCGCSICMYVYAYIYTYIHIHTIPVRDLVAVTVHVDGSEREATYQIPKRPTFDLR